MVAVKNEENNIANLINCLKSQNYSKNKYEIIICNDKSTDNTLKIINNLKHDLTNLFVIDIKSTPSDWSNKKWALYNGIKRSKGEIILQTDADCIFSENWLIAMVQPFADSNTVTPSLVTRELPSLPTRSLSRPFGPRVLRTASASATAASTLLRSAVRPSTRSVSWRTRS